MPMIAIKAISLALIKESISSGKEYRVLHVSGEF